MVAESCTNIGETGAKSRRLAMRCSLIQSAGATKPRDSAIAGVSKVTEASRKIVNISIAPISSSPPDSAAQTFFSNNTQFSIYYIESRGRINIFVPRANLETVKFHFFFYDIMCC